MREQPMFQKINGLLFKFPSAFHGVTLFLTGRRLTLLPNGSYRWLSRSEQTAVKLQGGIFSDENEDIR
jgi:hypothetical protein